MFYSAYGLCGWHRTLVLVSAMPSEGPFVGDQRPRRRRTRRLHPSQISEIALSSQTWRATRSRREPHQAALKLRRTNENDAWHEHHTSASASHLVLLLRYFFFFLFSFLNSDLSFGSVMCICFYDSCLNMIPCWRKLNIIIRLIIVSKN